MSETSQFLSTLSQMFIYLLPLVTLVALVFGVLVLKELLSLFKKLEITASKVERIEDKIKGMESSLVTSLEDPGLFKLNSYQNLQYGSPLVTDMINFGFDNSDEIIGLSRKLVKGYNRYKKKRKK